MCAEHYLALTGIARHGISIVKVGAGATIQTGQNEPTATNAASMMEQQRAQEKA